MSDLMNIPTVYKYISSIKQKANPGRHDTSLSYLVKRDISQSTCIRLGIVCEQIAVLLLSSLLSGKMTNAIQKTSKGKKQRDIHFCNMDLMTSIYAEVKGNINLDTEKAPATIAKINHIEKEVREKGFAVNTYLISLRYLRTADISEQNIKKKYSGVNLIGIADFIETMKCEVPIQLQNYEKYSEFLTYLTTKLEN